MLEIESNVQLTQSDVTMLDLFIRSQSTQSEQTARVYRSTLDGFMRTVRKPLRDVTFADLMDYVDSLSHLKVSTQKRMITTVRSFFTFLSSMPMALPKGNPTVMLKSPKDVQTDDIEHILTRDEIERIRAVLRYRNPRNHLIVTLFFATGLRLSELLNARWCDMTHDLHGNIGLRVIGKGRKARTVKLTKRIYDALCKYREQNELGDESPLFVNRKGEKLSSRYVEKMFTDAVVLAKIGKPCTIHWLRHSACSHALKNGATIFQVQQQLGHADLKTTTRYAHSLDRLQDAASDYIEMD